MQRAVLILFTTGSASKWGLVNLTNEFPFTSLFSLTCKKEGDRKKLSFSESVQSLVSLQTLTNRLRTVGNFEGNSWHSGLKTNKQKKTNPPDCCQYLPNQPKLKAVIEKRCTNTSVYLKEAFRCNSPVNIKIPVNLIYYSHTFKEKPQDVPQIQTVILL